MEYSNKNDKGIMKVIYLQQIEKERIKIDKGFIQGEKNKAIDMAKKMLTDNEA